MPQWALSFCMAFGVCHGSRPRHSPRSECSAGIMASFYNNQQPDRCEPYYTRHDNIDRHTGPHDPTRSDPDLTWRNGKTKQWDTERRERTLRHERTGADVPFFGNLVPGSFL